MAAFETRQDVMFQHCDPAGIVFYPRYVEMINAVVEQWFARGLEVPFAELVMVRRKGVPTARLEVDFRAPSRLGDVLVLSLSVTRIGKSSVTFTVEAHCEDQLRLTSCVTLVHVDAVELKSEPWPDDLRARIELFTLQASL
jgi:4-hydroxybenzoyl-CoA thioesterase